MRLVMPGLIRHPCHWSGALRGPPWIAGQARNDIDIAWSGMTATHSALCRVEVQGVTIIYLTSFAFFA
jgi:hypothetical protein